MGILLGGLVWWVRPIFDSCRLFVEIILEF